MTYKATPKLVPLGRANRMTRASSTSGVPETNPSRLYKAD